MHCTVSRIAFCLLGSTTNRVEELIHRGIEPAIELQKVHQFKNFAFRLTISENYCARPTCDKEPRINFASRFSVCSA